MKLITNLKFALLNVRSGLYDIGDKRLTREEFERLKALTGVNYFVFREERGVR
jgi:hypothetical protein